MPQVIPELEIQNLINKRRTSIEILLVIYQDSATPGSGVKFAMTVDDLRRRTIYMTADVRAPRRKTAM